jgi:hypothetical protein
VVLLGTPCGLRERSRTARSSRERLVAVLQTGRREAVEAEIESHILERVRLE